MRLAVDLAARSRTPEGWAEERVINLSTGGLALKTTRRVTPGSLQQLIIFAEGGELETPVQAEVVRVHGTPQPGTVVAGLRFRVLDAATTAQLEQLMLSALAARSGNRTAPRMQVHHEVFWSSGNFTGAASFDLVNVSQSGALLSGQVLPGPHALGLLSLRADGADDLLAVPAQVVWRRSNGHGQLAGVRFASDPSAVLLVRRILHRLLFHPPVKTASTREGTRIGEYELGTLLCRGQALEIYRATHRGVPVALKRFCGNPAEVPSWTERFLSAARIAPALNHHPGVVQVHGAVADAEECWLATELVEGSSFEQRLIEAAREGRRLPVAETLATLQQLLATLEDCHSYILDDDGRSRTVLHGDVRPSNVLFGRDGGARLTGFGAPFEARPERLAWLPPEALEERPTTPLSDVFQTGVLLYEALTGVLPFRAESVRQLLAAIVDGAPPPSRLNPDVPPALDALVRSALSAAPGKRPQSAAAFAEALARVDLVAAVTNPEMPRPQLVVGDEADARLAAADVPTEPMRPQPAPEPPLQRGERLGRYEIVGKLTDGGMAELFLARAEETPWPLVLKTVHPSRASDREVVAMFMNEARLVSQVDHPNIARITDVGFDRGRPFIAMEYFASRTLADVMLALASRSRPMPAELAAYITCEAAAGLDAAHGVRDLEGRPLHLVHRDVTAKNLLVGYDGGVKVIDFGIARAEGIESITTPGYIRGTAAWVSPEQARGGPVTPATDVWALGVNLYLMLAGQLPFSGRSDVELLARVTQAEPADVRRLRPDVPEGLAGVLPRALAKSPVERHPSMADLRDDVLASMPDPDACRTSLAALMDSLFPLDADEQRWRLAQLAPEELMPADASSPLKRLMGWLRR